MNQTKQPAKVKVITFQQWYETKYNKPLGLYLGNSLKKALVAEYEKETGNIYND